MTSRTVAKRGFSLDYVMWLFMRLSALALYAVGLTGLTTALVLGARTQTDIATLVRWTFFQNPMHVYTSELILIDSFINQYWQITELVTLFFGVTHGINGLRIVVEDYMGSSWWRQVWRGFIFFLWLFISLVAVYVVLAS